MAWYYDHDACVGKVWRYLGRKYTKADYEQGIVYGRITDAYGYNDKTKQWCVCEVKVEWPDVQQGPIQIFDTAFNLQKKHKECTVVPVLAIPDALERRLRRWRNWDGLLHGCNKLGVEIWGIESGAIRRAQGSKAQGTKAGATKPKATKAEAPRQ